MARKYVQMGKTNAENTTIINDNFAEVYENVSGIYEDVEQLKLDVAELQTDMTAAQQDITTLQNNVNALWDTAGRTPLSANTDLNSLGAGHYYIPNTETAATITNKPDTTNQTAAIDVVQAGSTGQLIMIYRGCIKEYINEWVRVYYADSWGDWLREGGNDSGWINLTLNDGWSMNDYTTDKPQYRKVGKLVMFRGLVNATAAAGTAIATLPIGFRPSANSFSRWACPHNQSGFVNIQVGTNGVISDYTKTTSAGRSFIALNGISYLVD